MIGGNPDEAMKLLARLSPEQRSSPQMLCVLGDVKKDISYYERAWEKSNHKYARAQRSIAKHHFYRQEFELSIAAFEKSLRLNRLDINSLSNLGYMHMARGSVEKAIESYSSVVAIDDNQSMAWANLAILYRRQGKLKEALKASQRAAAKNERSYQMLMNLQSISFDCEDYSEFVRATLKIIRLEKAEVLQEVTFKKLNFIMKLLFDSCQSKPDLIRSTELNFQKIEKIYLVMVRKFPLRDFLWVQLIDFIDLEMELLKLKRVEKMKAEKQGKQALFLVPVEDFQRQIAELLQKKYNVMQKRIHAKMPVGWQESLDKCEEVQGLVLEHQEFFKVNIGAFGVDDRKKYAQEFDMQIATVKGFISKIKEKV